MRSPEIVVASFRKPSARFSGAAGAQTTPESMSYECAPARASRLLAPSLSHLQCARIHVKLCYTHLPCDRCW